MLINAVFDACIYLIVNLNKLCERIVELPVTRYTHVKKRGSGEASRRINREFAAM